MQTWHWISFGLIAATWLYAWLVGRQWSRDCGLTEPVGQAALACVLPMSALIAAVHLLALPSLFLEVGWTTPATVAVMFVAIILLVRKRLAPAGVSASGGGRCLRGLRRLTRRGLYWAPLAVVGGMYLVFLLDAVTRYPTGYDTQAYHLPVAVTSMRQQNLNMNLGEIHETFPGNGEIVTFLLAFVQREWLFTLIHLPMGLLAAAAVYGLALTAGHRRRTALIAAVVALSSPMVVFQCFSSYIDLFAAAFWLCSLLALSRAVGVQKESQRRGLLVIAGLSAGVALGSKTTYLALAAMLLVVAGGLDWIRQGSSRSDRPHPLRHALIFGGAMMVCSMFWFVRGTVQASNPVYPLAISIGEREILPGYSSDLYFPPRSLKTRLQRWWAYPWLETKRSGTGYPYGVNNALGAAYAAFVVPGVLAAMLTALIRRSRGRAGPAERLRLVYLVLTLTGVVLLLSVFHEMLRFVFPQILLALVVACALLDRLAVRFRRAVPATLATAVVVTAAVAALKPAHALAGRIRSGAWSRSAFYQIPPIVDDLPAGARVLCLDDTSRRYALLGQHLSNDVISRARWRDAYADAPLSNRMLRDHAVDYVFVRDPWPTDWPDDLTIELIHDDTDAPRVQGVPASRLYRVLPAQGGLANASIHGGHTAPPPP